MKKFFALALAAFCAAAFAFAQESDFSSDDFGGAGDFGADDFGGGGFGDFGAQAQRSPLSIEGTLRTDFRAYVDDEDTNGLALPEWETKVVPEGKVDFIYSGKSTRANAKFRLSQDTIMSYQADIVDELLFTAYIGDVNLEIGKMRVVWGKGDKLHVLDNFNANDYTDFLTPDYIDRRISETMARVVWNIPGGGRAFSSSRLELVATPFMTADRLAMTGRWQPAQYKTLINDVITPIAKDVDINNAGDIIGGYEEINGDLMPNTYRLKYGQAGLRFTTTSGSWDWGVSYYIGRNKQLSVDLSRFAAKSVTREAMTKMGATNLPDYALSDLPSMEYDPVQIFGVEAAKTFGGFNFRAEFAYFLTRDTAGDDPWVRNNSINWVFGFDKDIPLGNLNINIQTIGKYVLKNDSIGDGDIDCAPQLLPYMKAEFKKNDVDYSGCGAYTNDRIVVNISDSWLNERVKAEILAVYSFEHFDLYLFPKVTVNVFDSFDIIASGLFAHSFIKSRSEYPLWWNNSFVQIGARYSF